MSRKSDAPLSSMELRSMLRVDFYSFLIRCLAEVDPSAQFLPNWHIELLAAQLAELRQGDVRRLIVNIPPRHLKSLAASVALPAWLLGHDPTLSIINVTYGQELSDKFARDFRTIVVSPWYQAAFGTRLVSPRAALQELITTAGGSRFATSIGGVLTGRGADIILIDDPLKPNDAMSETRRQAVNDWYDNSLYSRLNDKAKGRILVLMQRLHENDLVGHLLEREPWKVLSLAAIAEADERYEIATPLGPRVFSRKAGEALHPARESLKTLAVIRQTLGEYHYAGQYQQTPAPAGGGMVKQAWFNRYAPGEQPGRFDRIVQSWDTANKPSELADYSVCTTWGLKGPNFYLLGVLRSKLAYPDLKRAVIELAGLHYPQVILIEDKASGTQLIQELLEAGMSAVTRYVPEGDKIMRLHAQTATIENGFVYLPTEAPWLADYLAEMTRFPNGRNDDQVDSTAQFLAWAKMRPEGYGIMKYYEELAAERRSPVGMVRLRAPVGSSHVIGITGRQYMVLDGHIEVDPEDAKALIAIGFTPVP